MHLKAIHRLKCNIWAVESLPYTICNIHFIPVHCAPWNIMSQHKWNSKTPCTGKRKNDYQRRPTHPVSRVPMCYIHILRKRQRKVGRGGGRTICRRFGRTVAASVRSPPCHLHGDISSARWRRRRLRATTKL